MGRRHAARRRRDRRGLRVTNLIGLGPFHLAEPDRWDAQRERSARPRHGDRGGRRVPRVHDRPVGPLPWEEAADALEAALAPVLHEARSRGVPFAIEHTNSLRVDVGFVHTLRRRDRSRPPARRRRVHGAQRVLGGARARRHDPGRRRPTSARAGERLRGRDDLVVEAARARRRRHPARAHPRQRDRRGLRGRASTSS